MTRHDVSPTRPRPWTQISLSTLLIGFAALSIMVAANVNGVHGPAWYIQTTDGDSDIVCGLLYGWPMTFYATAEKGDPIGTSMRAYFVAEALAVDCVVAIAFVSLALALSEYIHRRRGT